MQKWENTSAGKIQCKRFNEAWNALNWEHNTFVELTGVAGQSERSSVLSVLCGSNAKRADVTAAQEAIGARFGWTVTAKNVNEIIEAVKAETIILQQNRPVHDERTTPDAEAVRRAEQQRRQEEGKLKAAQASAAFVAHYGSGEKITVQPGQMAVVARVCFDNSDTMSDYFDRHASLSQSFALLVVPKQAETERLARRGAELLADVEFGWHTEKYSMGHGNYLEATEGFELPADLQGIRANAQRAHWEITFEHPYHDAKTLDTFKGYGQDQTPPDTRKTVQVEGVTVTENDEKNGIEIRFSSKPSAEVLDSLKANGWRWSRFSSCWYAKRSESARQFTQSLGGASTEGGQEAGEKPAAPVFSPAASIAAKFRTLADALQPKIDHAGREMTQNPTPKRNKEYQSRLHDCRNMERTQKALRVLADAHESGKIPAELAGLKTRDQIGAMVRKSIDGSKGGFYSCIESDDYAEKTPAARVLQGMIEGDPEQRAERERLRKIATLEAEIKLSDFPGYFPTPAAVVAVMLDRARLEDGLTVLEPEAGSGHIADGVRAAVPGVILEVIEPVFKLRELLELKGYKLVGQDFMQLSRSELGQYDRIVMNPPFERQQDLDHIRHAYSLLAPRGILVSVLSPSFEFRSDRKSADFRAWLEEVNATREKLPDGSFKASGTGVSTRLVVINK